MLEKTDTTLDRWWDNVKAFFKRSETIFLSYVTMATGAITGLLAAIDFAPAWSFLGTGTEFTKTQLIGLGVGIFGKGVTDYVARVRHTKEVEGSLLPATAALPEDVKIVKKVKKLVKKVKEAK